MVGGRRKREEIFTELESTNGQTGTRKKKVILNVSGQTKKRKESVQECHVTTNVYIG